MIRIRKWLPISAYVVVFSLIGAGIALAATGPYGRNWNNGYFTGQPKVGLNWVFVPTPNISYDGLGPGCITNQCTVTLASFLQTYHDRLYDTSSLADRGRAAAEIDIMLGKQGPDFGSIQSGINYAQANFQMWSDLITIYADKQVPGYSVDFNYKNYPFSTTDINGMGVKGVKTGITGNYTVCTPADKCEGDIAFFNTFKDPGTDDAVVFYTNGKKFIIKHKCANLTGDFTTLVIPTSTVDIAKSSNHPAPMVTGTQFQYNFTVDEAANIPLTRVTISDTVPSQFKYVSTPPGDPVPAVSGQTLTWNFSAPAASAILTKIADGTQNLAITVQAVAAGNGIINTATGTAIDEFGRPLVVTPGRTVNTVFPESQPVVVGKNSDVHAGGGLCGDVQANGTIQGNLSGASMGQYVVTASTPGGISNFGSNNAVSGSPGDSLKAGGYEQVCREDLLTAAVAYYNDRGAGINIITGTNFDVSGASGLYYYTGTGNLTVSGTITNKVTLVYMNAAGAIVINGPINIGGGARLAADTPSLGIISAGDIEIDSPVTFVNAYLFANNDIYTCIQANATCDEPLTVDGFLMAHDIAFERLGPANATGNPVAESIIMTPQLYLNPPQFFTSAVDNMSLEGQGEQQPLF
jgi:hypothetical protein